MFVQWREGERVSVNHASNELLQESTTITIMHAYIKDWRWIWRTVAFDDLSRYGEGVGRRWVYSFIFILYYLLTMYEQCTRP